MRCARFAQTTDVQSDITKRTLGFCGALSKVGVTFQHADQQGSWDRYWASFLAHQQASSVFFAVARHCRMCQCCFREGGGYLTAAVGGKVFAFAAFEGRGSGRGPLPWPDPKQLSKWA